MKYVGFKRNIQIILFSYMVLSLFSKSLSAAAGAGATEDEVGFIEASLSSKDALELKIY